MSNNSRIILGILAGMAAGAALGLVFAPKNENIRPLAATGHRPNHLDTSENSINRSAEEEDDYNDHVEHV